MTGGMESGRRLSDRYGPIFGKWRTMRSGSTKKVHRCSESNKFGTNEFMRFCKMTHAEPYLAANLRSCLRLRLTNGWSTAIHRQEARRLRTPGRKPGLLILLVSSSGVWGNESWGCGGNFEPQEYASEFRRYTNWLPQYGVDLQLIGAGPNGNDIDWTHKFFEEIFAGQHPYLNPHWTGWSIHHYAANLSRGKTRDWALGKGDALQFDVVDWYELLRECDRIEQIMSDQWAVMGEYDPQHQIKLVVDEYGPWYREGTELDPTHIFGQQVTIRDALATAPDPRHV